MGLDAWTKKSGRKVFMINALAFVLLVVVAIIMDATRDLGNLHGALFSIFLLYGTGVFVVINIVLALLVKKRVVESKPFVICAGAGLLACILLMLAARIVV